jgi:lipid A ethanolaminephosphotransferase
MAPREQTSIPMIAWFSDAYRELTHLDSDCLRAESAKTFSHDNLFATVLGMMDIETSVYEPGLDAFAACRKKASSSA